MWQFINILKPIGTLTTIVVKYDIVWSALLNLQSLQDATCIRTNLELMKQFFMGPLKYLSAMFHMLLKMPWTYHTQATSSNLHFLEGVLLQ